MLKILEELEDDNVDNIKCGALNMAIFFLIKLHILNLQFYPPIISWKLQVILGALHMPHWKEMG